ncbi:MAG: hypothetical protein ABSB15_02135 [Bryobacteraceae bacterium]|jgi:hypothetical protein
MDEELKTWLAAMEARLDQRFDARLDEAFTRFSQHILNEMGSRFDEVKAQLNSMDARLKLHAGLIQSGARAMARFSKFGEDSEERWVSLVGRVAALEKRLEGK